LKKFQQSSKPLKRFFDLVVALYAIGNDLGQISKLKSVLYFVILSGARNLSSI
jgi:hypothetical protein